MSENEEKKKLQFDHSFLFIQFMFQIPAHVKEVARKTAVREIMARICAKKRKKKIPRTLSDCEIGGGGGGALWTPMLCNMTVVLSTLNFRSDGKTASHFIREWVTYYGIKSYVAHDWTFTYITASSSVARDPLFPSHHYPLSICARSHHTPSPALRLSPALVCMYVSTLFKGGNAKQ